MSRYLKKLGHINEQTNERTARVQKTDHYINSTPLMRRRKKNWTTEEGIKPMEIDLQTLHYETNDLTITASCIMHEASCTQPFPAKSAYRYAQWVGCWKLLRYVSDFCVVFCCAWEIRIWNNFLKINLKSPTPSFFRRRLSLRLYTEAKFRNGTYVCTYVTQKYRI